MRDLEKRIWDLETTVAELFYALKCLVVYENQPNAKEELQRAQSLFLGRVGLDGVRAEKIKDKPHGTGNNHSPDSADGPGVISVAPAVGAETMDD